MYIKCLIGCWIYKSICQYALEISIKNEYHQNKSPSMGKKCIKNKNQCMKEQTITICGDKESPYILLGKKGASYIIYCMDLRAWLLAKPH